MNIKIMGLCDGFVLEAFDEQGESVVYLHIDQEDSVECLVDFFKSIGIEASHKECY